MDPAEQSTSHQSPLPPVTQTPPIIQEDPPSISKQGPISPFGLILLVLFVFLAIGGGIYYLITQKNISVSQQISKVTPTAQASPTPDPTGNWQMYTNAKYSYSLKYPLSLKTDEHNTYYHYVSFYPQKGDGYIVPPYLVSVIADTFIPKDAAAYNYMSSDLINNFFSMQVGESTTEATVTFTKLPDMTVAGMKAVAIDVSATGIKQHRVYLHNNGNFYMIMRSYNTQDDLKEFDLLLSTFKLTEQLVDKDFWRTSTSGFSIDELAYIKNLLLKDGEPSDGKLVVINLQRQNEWASISPVVILNSTNQPRQSGAGMVLGHENTDKTWDLFYSGTSEFCTQLIKVPDSLVSPIDKKYFCQ